MHLKRRGIYKLNNQAEIQSTFAHRYALEKMLGQGGMAKVFLARDMNLGRRIALKVLLPQYASDPAFIGFFRDEAIHAAQLDSPRIVKVFDRGICDDGCYIAMEYIDGFSLRKTLRRHGVLPPYSIASIAFQVCEALETAHGKGVIHNDLKPANIMMTRTGDIKITDFGIANERSSILDAKSTPKKYIAGTACYMSPERAKGGITLPASDLFSLGVTMFELYVGTTHLRLLQDNDGRLTEYALGSNLPDKELGDIISICTQYDPMKRYSSASKLKLALGEYLKAHISEREDVIVPRANGPQYWVLQTSTGKLNEQKMFKVSRPLTIGRNAPADLRIGSNLVSGMHAKLTPWGACMILQDCGSVNGTLLNGAPVIKPMICYPGDSITLGDVSFRIGCKQR